MATVTNTQSKRMRNIYIAVSLIGLVVGVMLPIYLILGGLNGHFGIYATNSEMGVLALMTLVGLILQVVALVSLRKWLKILPTLGLIPNILVLLSSLISQG